jgi:3-(3-hydroxy-phenyl)propionate hydroxylase
MQSLPCEVDVLVVGYGPVGAVMGCLLGSYGVRTLVIDRSAEIFVAPRAIALDNEALRILQMAGLVAGDFETVVVPYVRLRSPYLGDFGRINTTGTIDGHPKLVTFYQPQLERALRARAQAHGCVTGVTSMELHELTQEGDRVRADLKGLNGSSHRVTAKFLVGADGAASHVRKAIGQEFTGQSYSEDWLVIDARNVPNNIDHVEFICDPLRPTPHMVAPGGRTRWEFMLNAGETREEMETDEAVRRLLVPWVAAGELQIERKAVYRFHARSCERYSKGRVFLVGDAAHVTPPFAGQGLVSGLRDAANLAWKLAWVIRGHANRVILETYDQERRPHAVKMIALAKGLGQLIMPRSALKAVLVHGFMKLLRAIPGLRGFLEEFGPKPKPVFERGLFVTGRGKLRRGAMMPQFRVRTAAGQVELSDELLGPHLALVGFGTDIGRQLRDETRKLWATRGGRLVTLHFADTRAGALEATCEILDSESVPSGVRKDWCVVVRPDRTILHDGRAVHADRIAREALALLDAPAREDGRH